MPLRFSYGKLSFEDVRSFLLETDNEFPTPLSACVDIDVYARKLSEFSDFSLCWDGESIVGMISCYTNRPPKGYISNVCVKKDYQRKGIFCKLFFLLLDEISSKGIEILRLEVNNNNPNALEIYIHSGFRVIERRDDDKLLLEYRKGFVDISSH